jgi:hypothetical protein
LNLGVINEQATRSWKGVKERFNDIVEVEHDRRFIPLPFLNIPDNVYPNVAAQQVGTAYKDCPQVVLEFTLLFPRRLSGNRMNRQLECHAVANVEV